MSTLLEITEANFKTEVLQSTIPVVIDCAAEWCGPCKKLAPIVEELSLEFSGKVKIGHLDVDQNAEISTDQGILSVPTLLFFKNGHKVDESIGLISKETLIEKINNLL